MFGRRLKLVGLAIGLAASGVAVLVANAQQQSFSPGALRGLFERYDANQDGEVTPGELKNDALFERLDSNRDGLLNLGEVRRALAGGGLRGKESEAAKLQEQLPHTEVAGDETKATPAEDVARDADAVRQAPTVLKGADVGIGRQLPDFTFTSLRGESSRLSDCASSNAVVLVMTGTGCPLCLKYAPSLASLEQQYKSRGVQFLFVNPNESESVARVQQAVDQHGLEGHYIRDVDQSITQLLTARSTTEVFVVDAARTLVYRGAVDDQYGFAYSLDAPRNRYLANALDAVLDGRPPAVSATSAPGCEIIYSNEVHATKLGTTYHNRISRILQANCIECHRQGGAAPIALENYAEVKDFAGMIASVVERKIMPPWFATTNSNPFGAVTPTNANPGHVAYWANDRSLSEADRNDLLAWIDAGMPEGDKADAPLPRSFPEGWTIGKPDAIFAFERPVRVKATGTMPYQNVSIETNLPEDRWVQAIEVRPGALEVVHHVLVFVQSSGGNASEEDEEQDGRTGYWGIYVPGNNRLVYPNGMAKKLPKGARLRLQMHYTPNGTATEDITQVGVLFAKEPPQHEVKVAGIVNPRIKIPAGASNHEEVGSLTLPHDVQVLGFLPHMHLRGKAARYEVVSGGQTHTILDIPRYDFNWQLLYRLAEPMALRAGDTLRFTAWYDNSAANPANPDPTKTVRWGPQTFDEMHLGYVEYIESGDSDEAGDGVVRTRILAALKQQGAEALFRQVDADGDGVLSRGEVLARLPGRQRLVDGLFSRLDLNADGSLSSEEFAAVRQLSALR